MVTTTTSPWRRTSRAALIACTALLVPALSLTAAPAASATDRDPEEPRLVGRGTDRGPADPIHVTGKRAVARSTAPSTDYQLPFVCGQRWVGSTRSYHSPSANSVDFNRTNDFNKPVVAAAAGEITAIRHHDPGSSYGRYVVLDHGDGESSLYAHLSKTFGEVGKHVDQGELIGRVGSSGGSTGPHLHFEERVGSTVVRPHFDGQPYSFGTEIASKNCADTPVSGDFVGDVNAELGLYKRTTGRWMLLDSLAGPGFIRSLGGGAAQPVMGDWDGNGSMDRGVRRPDGVFVLNTRGSKRKVRFGGSSGDFPIAGDWNGDGTWEVGLRKAGSNRFVLRMPDGSTSIHQVGHRGHIPVTGDWNNDGTTDVGSFNPHNGRWRMLHHRPDGTEVRSTLRFGRATDLPVVGDWNGNGHWDVGIWRPRSGNFFVRQGKHIRARQEGVRRIPYGEAR